MPPACILYSPLFVSRSHVLAHLRNSHGVNSHFSCPNCANQAFSDIHTWLAHLKERHNWSNKASLRPMKRKRGSTKQCKEEAMAKVKCYARKERETSLLFSHSPSLRVRGSSAFLGAQYDVHVTEEQSIEIPLSECKHGWSLSLAACFSRWPYAHSNLCRKHESEIYHGSNYDSYKINCRPQEDHSARTMIARALPAGRVHGARCVIRVAKFVPIPQNQIESDSSPPTNSHLLPHARDHRSPHCIGRADAFRVTWFTS